MPQTTNPARCDTHECTHTRTHTHTHTHTRTHVLNHQAKRCVIWRLNDASVWGKLLFNKYREEYKKKATLSSANLYLHNHLEQGKGPAQLQFLHATKGKGQTKTTQCVTNHALYGANARLHRDVSIFVFFLFFFSRLWKNQ